MININDFDIPVLNIGNRQGGTDYIDFIHPNEVNYPAMKGYDLFGRQFIVIKFFVDYKHICIQTFFQRYSNSNTHWQGCGHFGVNLIETYGGMNHLQFDFLKKILNGERLKLNNYHKPINLDLLDKYVELYDEEKINTVIFIQRHWRLCRYNPKYKMCEKVQMKNFELINNKI